MKPLRKDPYFLSFAAGLVGALAGFLIAQAGGLRITPAGTDKFDVRLFGQLAWTGTGHPKWTYGGLILGFMFVGLLAAVILQSLTAIWFNLEDEPAEHRPFRWQIAMPVFVLGQIAGYVTAKSIINLPPGPAAVTAFVASSSVGGVLAILAYLLVLWWISRKDQ